MDYRKSFESFLYVAMTRSKEKLFLIANNCTSKSQISEFIYDFESKYYKASGFAELRIFILEKRNLGYNRYKETPTPKVVGVSDSHQIIDANRESSNSQI